MATVRSFGAAQTVTGSCHLLELETGTKLLIDCGMFQGKEEDKNPQAFEFYPKEIDYLLITHAHLDHIGRIPKLVKEGFSGTIITTQATLDLAEVILFDSAKIMQEDYQTHYKKALRKGLEHTVALPLYTEEDVKACFDLKRIQAHYDKPLALNKDLSVTFKDAGHILGSAFIEITYKKAHKNHTIIFSGDIGNDNDMVLPQLESAKKADFLYVESTYGDRNHKNAEKSIQEFKQIIIDTMQAWGNVVIPSFAIERTQEILCILRDMSHDGTLPECRVFVDSPMASRATDIYRMHTELLSKKCQKNHLQDGTVFHFKQLQYALSPKESKAINGMERRTIIIAGSGMCTGGRVLHHLKHRLWNRKNAIIFVGYQATGTLGRHIVEGAQWVKIYHEDIKVAASIHTLNGFSAHADQSALLQWIQAIKALHRIFLIHGEADTQEQFKKIIHKTLHKNAHIVKEGEIIYLNKE